MISHSGGRAQKISSEIPVAVHGDGQGTLTGKPGRISQERIFHGVDGVYVAMRG